MNQDKATERLAGVEYTIRRTSTRPAELYDVMPAAWPKDATGVGAYVTSVYVYPSKENARLIAAAADLLEAAKSALDRLQVLADADEATDNDMEVLADLEAAIRKATGEGGAA